MFHELDDPHKYDEDNEAMDYYTDEYYEDDEAYIEDNTEYDGGRVRWVFRSRREPHRLYLIARQWWLVKHPWLDWGEAESAWEPVERFDLLNLKPRWAVLTLRVGMDLEPGQVVYVTDEMEGKYLNLMDEE